MHSPVYTYAHRVLYPVEVVLIARYRERLAGRVLEPGCGAGRVLGYLIALGGEVHGFDIAPAMVDYVRRVYPGADVRLGDLCDLERSCDGPYDVIFAAFNLLDGFDHATRLNLLGALRGQLAPDGLLIFSSHNLAFLDGSAQRAGRGSRGDRTRAALAAAARRPTALPELVRRVPRRIRNRRALRHQQYREADHAVINDRLHDYALLHYYIGRDAQERQLADRGLRLVECLDLDGAQVDAGEPGDSPWLYYVATPV